MSAAPSLLLAPDEQASELNAFLSGKVWRWA
jgi:hypothetical protein